MDSNNTPLHVLPPLNSATPSSGPEFPLNPLYEDSEESEESEEETPGTNCGLDAQNSTPTLNRNDQSIQEAHSSNSTFESPPSETEDNGYQFGVHPLLLLDKIFVGMVLDTNESWAFDQHKLLARNRIFAPSSNQGAHSFNSASGILPTEPSEPEGKGYQFGVHTFVLLDKLFAGIVLDTRESWAFEQHRIVARNRLLEAGIYAPPITKPADNPFLPSLLENIVQQKENLLYLVQLPMDGFSVPAQQGGSKLCSFRDSVRQIRPSADSPSLDSSSEDNKEQNENLCFLKELPSGDLSYPATKPEACYPSVPLYRIQAKKRWTYLTQQLIPLQKRFKHPALQLRWYLLSRAYKICQREMLYATSLGKDGLEDLANEYFLPDNLKDFGNMLRYAYTPSLQERVIIRKGRNWNGGPKSLEQYKEHFSLAKLWSLRPDDRNEILSLGSDYPRR